MWKTVMRYVLLTACVVLSACANLPSNEVPADAIAGTAVVAKRVTKDGSPVEVTDTFSLNDPVIAHITLRWDMPNRSGGEHLLSTEWSRGDLILGRGQKSFALRSTPYYVWYHQTALLLGAGPATVKFFLDGHLVATKSIVIQP